MGNFVRSLLRLFLLAIVFVLTGPAQSEPIGSSLSPEHGRTLERWLTAKKLLLRPATIADFVDSNALAQARAEWGNDYYPYYRVGDFNRDSDDDFAIVLIDPTSKEKTSFSIAVFHGGGKQSKAPALFEKNNDLSKSGLFESVGLIVMSFSDREDCFIHLWDGTRYIVKKCSTPPESR